MKKALIFILLIALAIAGIIIFNKNQTVTQSRIEAEKNLEFAHPTLKFSFSYPKDHTATTFADDTGDIVLVQKDGAGVQIFSMTFDEPASALTAERIKQDLPDLSILRDRQETFGQVSGLYFETVSEIGTMHEFWFVQNGRLFQASAPVASAPLIGAIMKTFK